ncbi:hypothetical protein CNE_BB2p00960 (plasmid) [Cupriavidus necator N-1]|uniref:DUF1302 domain-containing protein n=1 Tax=Cupriavidus necator (strain ATCC 43291 / DSM 13513 / CCUG 52238 / LMG 8453 / N-1) TaxID=1042878 RepID=F8GYG9_CUPNN|nr:DUF1302 domain-containing protein [Cupriavidus necator]AEI82910.1 hypothetical protein CNE_BB2p00960 [Cupriavidus necator N-1]MDX6008706.1 DUF1302 domain-containing protein [Cupriavidus necator]
MNANTFQARAAGALALALCAQPAPPAHAFQIPTDNEDLTIRWDNTIKYSVAQRLKDRSPTLTADANADDGDRNFRRWGLISNRVDLLSEFDVSYRNFGVRVSGAAWYDDVYNRGNDNDSVATANAASVPHDRFPGGTRTINGRNVELLDAFAFGKVEVSGMPVSVRLGQHSVLYGESLFFGNNGIAAAQSPIDLVKLLSVPNTQFKELIRPVPQVSGQVQVTPNLAVGGYYQFDWERNRLPGVGSYFSAVDILDAGGERILAGPGAYFSRTGDIKAKSSGQGGVQLRYRPRGLDAEFGLYAANFHAKDPVVYTSFAGQDLAAGKLGQYQLVFPEDIKVIGTSFSTTLGTANVAGELSYRHNMPLVARGGSVFVPPGMSANNAGNPLYPVGDTLHGQISWINLLSPTALWEGGSIVGEIAWNRRLGVSRNGGALDPNATRDAGAIRMVFQPAYYQVINGLDINVPIGIGYGLFGKSSVLNPGFGVHRGGDLSVGVNGVYEQVWNIGLNYTHYFGPAATVLTPPNAASQAYSYGQTFKDRDFVSLTIQRAF